MKKVAIVIGHHRLAKGSQGKGIPVEYDYNGKVANTLQCYADIYEHNPYLIGYTSRVKATSKKLDEYDLVLCLHYNSSFEHTASGVEAWHYFKNHRGKYLALEFCKRISNRFGTRNRGAKAMYSNKQRGFAEVYYPKGTTLLLEPFFGDNIKDNIQFKNPSQYIGVLEGFINDFKKGKL